MGIDDLSQNAREAIRLIAERHGAYNIRVFGSVARGEAHLQSDLDLLVDVRPNHSAWFPGGLIADLEEFLERHVEVVEPDALDPLIRDAVLKEAILL